MFEILFDYLTLQTLPIFIGAALGLQVIRLYTARWQARRRVAALGEMPLPVGLSGPLGMFQRC